MHTSSFLVGSLFSSEHVSEAFLLESEDMIIFCFSNASSAL